MTPPSSGGPYAFVGDVPAGVAAVSTELGHVGGTLGTLAGEVEHDTASIKEHWPRGHTGQLASSDAARIGGALDECRQAFANAGQALNDLHEVLVVGRRKVDELNEAHRALSGAESSFQDLLDATHGDGGGPARLQHGQDVLKAAQARSGFASLADIDRAYARVKAHVTGETTVCTAMLGRLTAEGRPPGEHAAGTSRYDVSFGLLSAWSAGVADEILSGRTPFPSDPASVHDAWILLSADQRAELLASAPARFGNLNGIPAKDRDTANRITLSAQLELLQKASEDLGIRPPNQPKDLDQIPLATLATLAQMTGVSMTEFRQALLLREQLARNTTGDTHLLAYEPGAYGGKGRAAIAFGDVDQADNVGVSVPGLNSGLHNFNEVTGDALNLYNQALQADPLRRTAMVAWQGYDAPDVFAVPFQGKAEAGAKLLAADVNAMRTTHAGPIGMLTVVGHSYGSTTTGLALQREHLTVDQVALIGSPGVGGEARTVADLGLDRSRVFVGSASQDPVTTWPDSLGEDPAEVMFGATRFKAESVERGGLDFASDHSRYYDSANHSESLYNLANIVTGHGDRLVTTGMLAEARRMETVPAADESGPFRAMADPEAGRVPTAGFDHANDVRGPSR